MKLINSLLALLLVGVANAGVLQSSTVIPCDQLTTPKTHFDIVNTLLQESRGYNKDVRPTYNSSSLQTIVTVDYYVAHVVSIDQQNGQLRIQLLFRQRWQDSRLTFADLLTHCQKNQVPESVTVPASLRKELWTPDLYITQELESVEHGLFHPNVFMRIGSTGEVLLSQRITVTIACPDMATDKGRKECDMNVESYAHQDHQLALEWKGKDPIYVLPTAFIPNGLSLDAITPSRCDTATPTATYSCLQGKFQFSK